MFAIFLMVVSDSNNQFIPCRHSSGILLSDIDMSVVNGIEGPGEDGSRHRRLLRMNPKPTWQSVQSVVQLRQQPEYMDLLLQQLRKIGLNNYEAMIYSILIKESPVGASAIAKKCKLPRSSVYTSLSSLISQGLVATTYQNNVKQFIAQDFSVLENSLHQQKEQVNERLKIFEDLQNHYQLILHQSSNLPSIMFFEGEEGLKKIYESMIRDAPSNEIFYVIRDEFIWTKRWKIAVDSEWSQRTEGMRMKKNIPTHLLINDSELERSKKDFYNTHEDVKYKFLPQDTQVQKFGLYIIEDVFSILSVEEENLIGFKVHNKNIAHNLKKLFHGLWNT